MNVRFRRVLMKKYDYLTLENTKEIENEFVSY